MAGTGLMAAILIGIFALMFGLVKFSEAVIDRNEAELANENSAPMAREM